MRTTTDILQDIDTHINHLAEKCLKTEMQNVQLKEVIKILSVVVRGDKITQAQSDYIQRVVTEANIFSTDIYENVVDNVIEHD